ncbi:hypothetical protein Tco_0788430, partial [Tanacetum coccineum]
KPKRKDTQIPQSSDPSDNIADEAVHKELGDSLVRAATTASSLEAEQDSDNITKTRSKATPNESNSLGTTSGGGPRGNTHRSDEDRLKLNELMELCTNLQKKVLDLEKTKTTQANKIASLKRRVRKLEKKRSSRTHGLKRLRKVGATARVESSGDKESLGENASKQGRINAIDADEDITLVNVQNVDEEMFDVDALDGEEVFVTGQNENVVEEVVDATQVSTAATTVTITTKEITLAQAHTTLKTSKPKDTGKGIMIEEPMKPMKKKVQIMLNEEAALKLQAGFDEEERLAREKDKANVALIEEWDDIQAKIEADHELAQRLKHFAAKSAEEKRNKPPTQAQQREIICTYLKNMERKKLKDLKNKSFDSIQKMLDKAYNRVNTFVDFRTDLVEGSLKRAGEELIQEGSKKQKVDDDKETTKLKQCMEIIPNEEEVTIDVIPLAVKSLRIIYMLIEKRCPLTPPKITDMLNKKLQYKVNVAEGVNAASEEVSTAELVMIFLELKFPSKCPLSYMAVVALHFGLIKTNSLIVINSKALSEKCDWENPEGGDYPFDLTKSLPLVMSGNHQKVPVDYFFNNDLKYQQGGVSTMTYTTSITKTKAAQYDLPGIEDMVLNIWVHVNVSYDKHALWGISH